MTDRFPEVILGGAFPSPDRGGKAPRAWIRFSVPLAEGVLRPGDPLSLETPDGLRIPLQTRALATWRDGSVRWLDAETLAAGGGTARIREGGVSAVPEWPADVTVTENADGSVVMGNGLVAATLSPTGPSPIRNLRYRDVPVSDHAPLFEGLVQDMDGGVCSSRHETGRSIVVRSRGPVRAVADVCGRHVSSAGRPCLSYRLRVEVCAGAPVLTLAYWVLHEDPGVEEHRLRQIAAVTRWKTASPVTRLVHQTRYSMLTVPREVMTGRPVDIRSGPDTPWVHVQSHDCWHDEHEYPDFVCDPRDTRPYLGLTLESASVVLHVEDFAELYPKALTGDGNDLTLHVWPAWAGELRLRQGWSRQAVMRAVFFDPAVPVSAAALDARLAAVSGGATATIPPDWYAGQKTWFMDTVLLNPRRAARDGGELHLTGLKNINPMFPGRRDPAEFKADRFLSELCRLPTAMGMWDLGDTIDPGYTTTYSYLNRTPRLPGSPPQRFLVGGQFPRRYLEENMLHNEPVWTNNEYDVILCLARECMRGGRTPELWQKLRWFGRHAVEVDFVHYSDHPERHHGSPAHSVRHCMATAYPSHLWCEGLLMYYCLTGDDDALDVSVKMGDFIVRTFHEPGRRGKLWKFSRELGWALLYLACVADLTREQRFFDMADEITAVFTAQPLDDKLLDDMLTYSFAYASMALGMEMYHRVTGRKDLADWLTGLADQLLRRLNAGAGRGGTMSFVYFIAAATVSGERRYLEHLPLPDDLAGSLRIDEMWLHTKQVAMAYRPYSRLFELLRR